jgi:WD40-like Beta Propeller Repeat/Tetratricopeptide repeat
MNLLQNWPFFRFLGLLAALTNSILQVSGLHMPSSLQILPIAQRPSAPRLRAKWFVSIFTLLALTSCAQPVALRKANELFKNQQYGTALPHFETAAKQDSLNYNIWSKLAYCYHMTNRQTQAATLYQRLMDSGKERALDYFYYAETLLYLGKYDEAQSWVEKYAIEKPEDERSALLIKACREAKNITPLFTDAIVYQALFNSDADDNSPSFWREKVIFSSDRKSGFNPLKQRSGATGRDFINLYAANITTDSSEQRVSGIDKLNGVNINTSNASVASDAGCVVFCQNSVFESKQGEYNLQLFIAQPNQDSGGWRDIELLTFCTPEHNYMHPCISADGLEIYFVSDRSGGLGGTDIYRSYKNSKGWSKPESVSDFVNTAANEGYPTLSPDGKLYFCSKGHAGLGGYDVLVAEAGDDNQWINVRNVGAPINSPADDFSLVFHPDGIKALFTSSRGETGDDIYWLEIGFISEDMPIQEVPAPVDTMTPRGK